MFKSGIPQSIIAILDHREERAKRQEKLLNTYTNTCLITATLNIPGPIKNNQEIHQLMLLGSEKVTNDLTIHDWQILHAEEHSLPVGNEVFWVINTKEYKKIKQLLINIEENFFLGRLFDLDIQYLDQGIPKLIDRKELNYTPRSCLICNQIAKVCARSQAHSVDELQQVIEKQYQQFLQEGKNHADI